jgi:hypothetical protein
MEGYIHVPLHEMSTPLSFLVELNDTSLGLRLPLVISSGVGPVVLRACGGCHASSNGSLGSS